MQSFSLTHVRHVSFGLKKKDINRNSYRMSIYFLLQLELKIHPGNNQVEFFNTLDNLCQFETMDYIKKLETSAKELFILVNLHLHNPFA